MGFDDGWCVGFADGKVDGFELGLLVGVKLGRNDGCELGSKLCAKLGRTLGVKLESTLGVMLGVDDGLWLGELLTDGTVVGASQAGNVITTLNSSLTNDTTSNVVSIASFDSTNNISPLYDEGESVIFFQ